MLGAHSKRRIYQHIYMRHLMIMVNKNTNNDVLHRPAAFSPCQVYIPICRLRADYASLAELQISAKESQSQMSLGMQQNIDRLIHMYSNRQHVAVYCHESQSWHPLTSCRCTVVYSLLGVLLFSSGEVKSHGKILRCKGVGYDFLFAPA